MINVKAFVLDHEVYLERIKRITHYEIDDPENVQKIVSINYKNSKMCNYCEQDYFIEDLTKKLT